MLPTPLLDVLSNLGHYLYDRLAESECEMMRDEPVARKL